MAGDTVLLAPAAASFDQYNSFEKRGEDFIAEVGKRPQDLVPLLQAVQKKYNYLPPISLERIAQVTEIAPAEITGVSTFYSQFRLEPVGKHTCERGLLGFWHCPR